ncbi:MAG: AraC family transcriptional regulator [Brevundimonas sp.]|nr:AraC family transcriptional regulator [Brevundimonas sp.]
MKTAMDELSGIVVRAGSRWTETGLPRVRMVRSEGCPDQVYEPMLHLVLQGSKRLSIGDDVLLFEEGDYLVVPVHVPATGEVRSRGPHRPYLAVSLTLEPAIIAGVMAEMSESGTTPSGVAGFSISAATPEMLDGWLRMMRLIDRVDEAPMLASAIEREILFRVLMGPQGHKLREIACAESRLSQVRPAIGWLRDNFAEPIRVGPLAAMTGMSIPAFYRHFKAVTSMAPIQYQKRLRLLKARRLMLFEDKDAGAAAYAVGYESASQFSREYARLFGLPPARDAARFRLASTANDDTPALTESPGPVRNPVTA